MLRSLAATILSAALAVTSVAPTTAWAETAHQPRGMSQDDVGRLVFGLTALAIFAAVAKNANKGRDDDDDDRRHEPPQTRAHEPRVQHYHAPQPRPAPPPRYQGGNALPGQCLNRIHTDHGVVRLFTQRCLRLSGVHLAALPQGCFRQVHTRSGQLRQGFVPRCLRRNGYVTAGRH